MQIGMSSLQATGCKSLATVFHPVHPTLRNVGSTSTKWETLHGYTVLGLLHWLQNVSFI